MLIFGATLLRLELDVLMTHRSRHHQVRAGLSSPPATRSPRRVTPQPNAYFSAGLLPFVTIVTTVTNIRDECLHICA